MIKNIALTLLMVTGTSAITVIAKEAPATTDVYAIARTATGNATYNYVEAFAQKGKLIPWDVSYIDFGSPREYRELIVGAGGVVYDNKKFTALGELYFDQAFGPTSKHASYFIPWVLILVHPTQHVNGEATYFPYLPLNDAGSVQHVLERAKLEYNFNHVKIGGGYGGYQFSHNEWQSRPFITTTVKAGSIGNIELWLQRLPRNHLGVQIRYDRVFHHKPSP